MDFKLHYVGAPGAVSATLSQGGSTIASVAGLKDGKAAKKWAAKEARDHKVANTPEATEDEVVTIAGDSTFSL